jgi:glycosyltransferase involved in cell wall biosynthesis
VIPWVPAPRRSWRREYDWVPDQRIRPDSTTGAAGVISACIVVRNEERTIARCLDSLRGVVDECIVVHDGPCADRTIEIAAERGCRVFEAPFYGHCERHTPRAYQEARGEWILNLDADEFLSSSLADHLRQLTEDTGVDGYELLWKHWDGARYVTDAGPYKLALFRRRAARMIGIIHVPEEIDGVVRRVPLHLEHRPPAGHRGARAILRKFGRRAGLQAREYLSSLNGVPRFNYPGTVRWSRRREMSNRWAPLLIGPAALHTFYVVSRNLWRELGVGETIRFASTEAIYRAMVTATVAWYRYIRPDRLRRTD